MRERVRQQAERIAALPREKAVRLVRVGMKRRFLSTLVRCLNALERNASTRPLARRALGKLGFPT
ncbi:MAG: hypothetical protein EKK41_28140 [Hyphomicrobiales bacterium]|nr:MAG: hypothetical protein EKK41_28140 [Hyphomicrobiales bacterium]